MTTNRIERGREIASTGRATPVRRTSRIPTRPALPTRDVAAPRGSAGPAGCSGRTSRTSTPPSSSASSFAGSPRADARNTRARRSPSAGAERPDPAYPAGRGGGAETGTRASAPPAARRVPETCPSRAPGASAPNAPRLSARQRVGLPSPHAHLRASNTIVATCRATSSAGQG